MGRLVYVSVARTSDFTIERSDGMSRAFGEKDFLGTYEGVDLQQVFLDFLVTAKEIRAALGEKAYLLDEYVYNLLEGFCETRNGAGETLSVGYEAGMTLNGVCTDIMEHKYKKEQDEFYLMAKKYIEAHPLPHECSTTKRYLFTAMLNGLFCAAATAEQSKEAVYSCSAVYDELNVSNIYERICTIAGDSTHMERLNDLFRQRFLQVSSQAMFLQGQALGLAQALAFRDIETNKRVVHLLIDGILPPSEYN